MVPNRSLAFAYRGGGGRVGGKMGFWFCFAPSDLVYLFYGFIKCQESSLF